MQSLSRRHFLAASGVGIAAAALHADPLSLPIGCQTYPVRDALGKDLNGTLHQLASIGYKHVEMCSPPGYANGGYGPLVKMKASEIRDAIHSAGLGCASCHYQFAELKSGLDDRIAYAQDLGLQQMVLSTFGLPNSATLSDWSRAADELNRIGGQVRRAGMQMGFHNHNFEFKEIDGALVYDHLMQRFDASLVQMQFQVSVISLGYEAATYLTKYPGRFLSLHLQDWSSEEKKQVPVGKGVVDWTKLFAAAKKGGVKNYFVELGMDALQPSYDYLHAMRS